MHADKQSERWKDRYPLLWGLITQGTDCDGAFVQTGTLLLFLEEGRIKLCLHDRHNFRVAFLTVSGMPEGLCELEDALLRGTLDWRVKKQIPMTRTKSQLAGRKGKSHKY